MIVDASGSDVRVVGPNIVGLQRRGFSPEVRSALKDAFKLLYREGFNRTQALERIKYEVPDIPEVRYLVEFYQKSGRGVH
jgi:UDP-N-acetylglucosamine acyltransferase